MKSDERRAECSSPGGRRDAHCAAEVGRAGGRQVPAKCLSLALNALNTHRSRVPCAGEH